MNIEENGNEHVSREPNFRYTVKLHMKIEENVNETVSREPNLRYTTILLKHMNTVRKCTKRVQGHFCKKMFALRATSRFRFSDFSVPVSLLLSASLSARHFLDGGVFRQQGIDAFSMFLLTSLFTFCCHFYWC